MEDQTGLQDALIAQAAKAKEIMALGLYQATGTTVDIRQALASSRAGVRLVTPAEWEAMTTLALRRCNHPTRAALSITDETTLAALTRLLETGAQRVAVLNFASARRPGGGWDTGACAQEESLARASGLIATLAEAPRYYEENLREESLFYTAHAIWSPRVPFFAQENGRLRETPLMADVITMPAPNIGGMLRLTERNLMELPGVWRHRIRCVLALAIQQEVQHLVLGAWGCGAFGNDPKLVARWFREALFGTEPWMHGLESVCFAIKDTGRRQPCLTAFREQLQCYGEGL